MDAPLYPPAVAYEQPVVAPYLLSARGCSIAELMRRPDAWAVVLKYMPLIKMIAGSQQIQPHLRNFTLLDLAAFTGQSNTPVLDQIDEELKRLPPEGWSA